VVNYTNIYLTCFELFFLNVIIYISVYIFFFCLLLGPYVEIYLKLVSLINIEDSENQKNNQHQYE
jgi:hypothetical protein